MELFSLVDTADNHFAMKTIEKSRAEVREYLQDVLVSTFMNNSLPAPASLADLHQRNTEAIRRRARKEV